MPSYQYEAYTVNGERTAGSLSAADHGEALRKLGRSGLRPFKLSAGEALEKTPCTSSQKSTVAAATAVSKEATQPHTTSSTPLKLTRGQVIQFTEELCDLLSAGLQLGQALEAMENRSHVVLRSLSSQIRVKVHDGIPFSVALRQASPSFGELYCNLAAAGEAGGDLSSILKRQVRYLVQMEGLRSKVISAMIYPFFIIGSGAAVGIVFITYLLPKLAVMIESTQDRLPLVIKAMLGVSDFLKAWWIALLLLLVILAMGAHLLLKSPARRLTWHRLSLRLPIFGPVLQTRFEVQFLETLGNLLKNGLPLHRGLELARNATTNLHLQARVSDVEKDVHDGVSLSRALTRSRAIRPLVVDMVRIGEQTGEMAQALERAAGNLDSQFGKTLERATALMQPVIMLVMAAMVGGMAWMMIHIVFSTLQQVNQR